MPYQVPTLDQSVQRARERFRAEMAGTDAMVWPNNVYVQATVMGGEVAELYEYLNWISRQRFATTADDDQLDLHGSVVGVTRRAESVATGTALITGLPNTEIPKATILTRSDGVQFITTDRFTIGNSASVDVTVDSIDAGPTTNSVAGTKMTLGATITGVDDTATVLDPGLSGGADTEDDESYRRRILLRLRYPPHGGAAHDYVFWALSVAGVTRVWVDPLAYGAGTVGVWFMMDDTYANGIPLAADVGNVQSYIDSQKPATARIFVKAPIAATIDVSIDYDGTPSAATQTRIENEIKDAFRRQTQVSLVSTKFTLSTNVLWQAVAIATGSSSHRITIPAADIEFPAGYVPVLGSICFS